MKIQCDVCDKNEASVFCVADEAALCSACDHRVHHANKLAEKHQRFTLHHPSPKQVPICDICQERRAFLFCQQDRAILCRDCDISIHKANEHTQKHERFLLTGPKLSANSAIYSASPSQSPSLAESASSNLNNNNISDSVPNIKSRDSNSATVSVHPDSTTLNEKSTTAQSTTVATSDFCGKISTNVQLMNGGGITDSISTSSISEYLMETLPGWHVEDFLDSSSSSTTSYGFSENGENDVLQFWNADLESNTSAGFPTGKMGFWVPQVSPSPPLNQTQNQSIGLMTFGTTNGFKDQSKDTNANMIKFSRKWSEDNSFAVPQINQTSNAPKRSRTFW